MGRTFWIILIIIILVVIIVFSCQRISQPPAPSPQPVSAEPVADEDGAQSTENALIAADPLAVDLAVVKLNIATLDAPSRKFIEAIEPTTIGTAADWTVDDDAEIVGFGLGAIGQMDMPMKRRGDIKIRTCQGPNSTGQICLRFIALSEAANCGGDSGGPMLISTANGKALIGVASTVDAQCDVGEGRYVDVTSTERRNWLISKMSGYTPSPYELVTRSKQGSLPGGTTHYLSADLSVFNGEVEHMRATLNYPGTTPGQMGSLVSNHFDIEMAENAANRGVCDNASYPEISGCKAANPTAVTWTAGVHASQGHGFYQLTLTGLRRVSPGP